jgi:transcriptional regulator with XRE-family HTH domain
MAARGMNAAELCVSAQVSKGYLSEILNGKKAVPSFKTCKKFSDVLQISLTWLIYGEGTLEESTVREDPPAYRVRQRAGNEALREPQEMTIPERLAAIERNIQETKESLVSIQASLDILTDLFVNRIPKEGP